MTSFFSDNTGLVTQKDQDGGDTCQNEHIARYAYNVQVKLSGKIAPEVAFNLADEDMNRQLEPNQDGNYIRHPKKGVWWSDPKEFSRDQMISVIIYLGETKQYDKLDSIFKAFLKRGFRYQNKDIGFIELFYLFGRAYSRRSLLNRLVYPLVFLGDLSILVNTFARIGWLPRFKYEEKRFVKLGEDDVGDDKNHVMCLLQSCRSLPTPISYLSKKIYKWFKPKNYGNYVMGEKDPIMGALMWGFREAYPSNGNQVIAELLRPLVMKYF